MCRVLVEGEVRFRVFGAWQCLKLFRQRKWINSRGYLLDSETHKLISHDDDPHYRHNRRRLTIPRHAYPVEFRDLVVRFMSDGWLICEHDCDSVMLCIQGNKTFINYKALWHYLTNNNMSFITRNYDHLDDGCKCLECAFYICKWKVIKNKYKQLSDVVCNEVMERLEATGIL